jgi:hypothetical protein
MLKVGDKVVIINKESPSFGEIREIVLVKNGIAWFDITMGVGYHAKTGASRLDKEDGKPLVRKLTPLDELL